MQVSDKVYIDIKVKGSENNGKGNIVQDWMIQRLEMVETAGASLPYICFSFATLDKDVVDLYMENNEVIVSIGESKEKAESFNIHSVINTKDTDPSNNAWTVYYGGFIGDNSYMMNKNACKEYPGNSLMVIDQVVKNYAKMETNIEKTNENQVLWRQLYSTTNVFLADTILHMDIRPSFPLFAFDKHGTFHVRDFNKLREGEPQWVFTPYSASAGNEIQYINNFTVESFKSSYNLYSGYNKVTEIYKAASAATEYAVEESLPILASTKEAEKNPSGNRISLNKIQSDNVHNTYMEAFAHNTNCLMSMSSMLGYVEFVGYYPELKPTDLVYVKSDQNTAADSTIEGYYIIDTVVTTVECEMGVPYIIKTKVYVTRDNKNNVENFVTEKKKKVNITKKAIQALANAVARARIAIAKCSQIMDGTFLQSCMSFITASKNNLLRMFSISGTTIDFTSQARFLQSMLCQGNTLMNILLNMLFPSAIAFTLRDFLIDKPSSRALLGKYIDEYVPVELQDIISELADSLLAVHTSLNSIAEDNGITAREIPEVEKDNSSFVETENRLNEIFEEFENNTTGLDVPFPIVDLTESQQLLPQKELKDLVATETIQNLTDLGYMDGVDEDLFKDILLGNTPINFDIINQINENAGNGFNFRYWGTYGVTDEALYAWSAGDSIVYTKSSELSAYTRLYNSNYSPYLGDEFKLIRDNDSYIITFTDTEGDTLIAERNEAEDVISNALAQLTEFYITKGYKDKYRTIPCTKLISATKNARIYFACPQSEQNLRFYINSKRITLNSFPIDLGFRDIYGNKIMYTVYYTETGYNSNSTMMEIRQG